MAPIRSAYKHPTLPRKQTPCAICMLQTDGKTQLVELTHGVSVWLCRWHASEEFRTMRSGRDFDLTLFLAWRAQNGYTRNHAKALAAHRRALQGRKRRSEHDLPGSYHWKALRNEAEERFAAGETLRERPARPAAAPCRRRRRRAVRAHHPPLVPRRTLAARRPDRRSSWVRPARHAAGLPGPAADAAPPDGAPAARPGARPVTATARAGRWAADAERPTHRAGRSGAE